MVVVRAVTGILATALDIVVSRVVASISATAVDIYYIVVGRVCSEYIGYNCKPMVVVGVVASILATTINV